MHEVMIVYLSLLPICPDVPFVLGCIESLMIATEEQVSIQDNSMEFRLTEQSLRNIIGDHKGIHDG